ncbi:MAG: hypothetical protein GHCLOJNM_04566 [bacterium]|nr:hypothetical protein [bacterium]
MERVSISDFKRDSARVLNRVRTMGERIVIHSRDEDLAVVVSLEEAALLRRLEDEHDLEEARHAKEEVALRGAVPLSAIKRRFGVD